MYHDPTMLEGRTTRAKVAVDLNDRHQLWNAIVDKVAGVSLSTKIMHMEWDIHHGVVEKKTGVSIQHHKVPTSYAGNELIDKKPHSPLLDTISKTYDPTNPRHPSRNESLHCTAVENGSKRKADSLEEAGDETNGARRAEGAQKGHLALPNKPFRSTARVALVRTPITRFAILLDAGWYGTVV